LKIVLNLELRVRVRLSGRSTMIYKPVTGAIVISTPCCSLRYTIVVMLGQYTYCIFGHHPFVETYEVTTVLAQVKVSMHIIGSGLVRIIYENNYSSMSIDCKVV
jgi:hypothetical protein